MRSISTHEHVVPDASGLTSPNKPVGGDVLVLLKKRLSHFEKELRIARGAREFPWQTSVHMVFGNSFAKYFEAPSPP